MMPPTRRVVPLFPSYLFVEVGVRWWTARWTTGVARVLTVNGQPAKVPCGLIEVIRMREVDGVVQLPAKPRARGLVHGDKVLITNGLFATRYGVYQGQNGAKRSKVLLQWLGREVQADLATRDMVKVG